MVTTWYACPFKADCVANRKYPKGTMLRLYNPKTRRTTIGVVRDYGPEKWTHRDLDVSTQIATVLGMKQDGVASLEVTVLGRP